MKDEIAKNVHGNNASFETHQAFTEFATRQAALAYIRERSDRGRHGALIRGGMLSRVAFGYALASPTSKGYGAKWLIVEERAAIVREIFERKAVGSSLSAIAENFNARGVEPPQGKRVGGPGQWRASTVAQILKNKIYRGVYSIFSVDYRLDSGTYGRKRLVDYSRPALRLVSDELWFAVNPPVKI